MGGAKTYYEMGFVSNQDFNHEELTRYFRVLREESRAPPARKHLVAKYKDLKQCASYAYNEEEVNAKIAENQEAGRLGNLAHLRHNIERQIAQQETLIARGGFPLEKPVKQPDGSTKIEVTTLEQALEKLAQLKRTQTAQQAQRRRRRRSTTSGRRARSRSRTSTTATRSTSTASLTSSVRGSFRRSATSRRGRRCRRPVRAAADAPRQLLARRLGRQGGAQEGGAEGGAEGGGAAGGRCGRGDGCGRGAARLAEVQGLLETPRACDGADGGATSSLLAGFEGSAARRGAKGAAVPSGAAPPPPRAWTATSRLTSARAPPRAAAEAASEARAGERRRRERRQASLGDYKRRTSGA